MVVETLRQFKWYAERMGYDFTQIMSRIDGSLTQVLGDDFPPKVPSPDERVHEDTPPDLLESPAPEPMPPPLATDEDPPASVEPRKTPKAAPSKSYRSKDQMDAKLNVARQTLDDQFATIGRGVAAPDKPVAVDVAAKIAAAREHMSRTFGPVVRGGEPEQTQLIPERAPPPGSRTDIDINEGNV